ncbi:hypothetical protein ACFUJU_28815 [Streptomyces sp. NPDC057235]|uniref:hypothetical protein n=1 Tax=Streptomyces sp. NPDC057235 TaxID=3346058 RepID=UPI00362EF6A3
MPFPDGTPTITFTGQLPPAVLGPGSGGTVILTPSAILTDEARHAVYLGGGQADIVDGAFSVEIIPSSAAGIEPAGWRWHVDIRPIDGKRLAFWADIPGSDGATVHLDDVAPTQAPGGGNVNADGKSAYEIAVSQGFEGTVIEWLASLVGPPGQKGEDGEDGQTGPQPPLGAAGAGADIALRSTDPTTSNARTPTGHAASHGVGGSDPVTVASSQVTGLAAALAALLPRAGGALTGAISITVTTDTGASIGGGVSGETFDRWRVLANGTVEWGPGGLTARDTTLRRTGVNELTASGSLVVTSALRHLGTTAGFFGAAAISKPTVTGSRGGNVALGSVISKLAELGLVIDNTTA